MQTHGVAQDARSQYLRIQDALHQRDKDQIDERYFPALGRRKQDANKAGDIGANLRHELEDKDRAVEALFMGLRLSEGVALKAFRDEYGVDVPARYADELPRLCDAGLIHLTDERIMLTDKGRLLSNEVFVLLI